MARWASAPRSTSTTPSEPTARPYRRATAHNELYRALATLPPSDHAAFLVEFAEKYPDYPGKRAVCPCVACLVAR